MNKLMYVESAVLKIPFKKISFDYKVFKKNSLNVYQSLIVRILVKNKIKVQKIEDLADIISNLANVKYVIILDFLKELEAKKILVKKDYFKIEDEFTNFKNVDSFLISFNINEGKNSVILGYNSELDLIIDSREFSSYSEENEYKIDSEVKNNINKSLTSKDKIIEKILIMKSTDYELVKWENDAPYLIKNEKVSNLIMKFNVDLLYSLEENNESRLVSVNFEDERIKTIFDIELNDRLLNSSLIENIKTKSKKPKFISEIEETSKILDLSIELSKSNAEIINIRKEIDDKVVEPLKDLKIKRNASPEETKDFKKKKDKINKIGFELNVRKNELKNENNLLSNKFKVEFDKNTINSRFKKFDKYKITHPKFIAEVIKLEKQTKIFFEAHKDSLSKFKEKVIDNFEFDTSFYYLRIVYENLFLISMEAIAKRAMSNYILSSNKDGVRDLILKKANTKLNKELFDNAQILKTILDYEQHKKDAKSYQKDSKNKFLSYDIDKQKNIVYSILDIVSGVDFSIEELNYIEKKL
jgi:hypothetical protein